MKRPIVLVGILVLIAVTAAAATAAPPTVTPTKWRFALHSTMDHDLGVAAKWWADELTKRTNGAYTFEWYPAAQLYKASEMLKAIGSGALQTGIIVPAYFSNQMPLMAGWGDGWAWADKREELWGAPKVWAACPSLEAELTKLNVKRMNWGILLEYGMFTKKPVNAMAEIKGMRVRTWGAAYPARWTPWGAVTVSINADEAYDAFSKGTLDICPGSTDAGVSYGFADVAKNFKEGPFLGAVGGLVMMNLDVYKSLPADVKRILADLEKEGVAQHVKIRDTLMAGYTAKLKQGGVKFTSVSAADEKRMLEICDSVIESYLTKDMDKIGKGTEGRALLAELRKVRIDYQAFLKTPEGKKWLEPKN